MATTNSTVYAKQINPTMANRLTSPQSLSLNNRTFEFVYTMLGTETAGDVINLVKLPLGAIVDPTLSTVVNDGAATTLTIDVGDDDVLGVGTAADADRYCDGISVASAGITRFDSIASAARLTPYALGGDAAITLTWATVGTPVAAKKLTFRIVYRIEA